MQRNAGNIIWGLILIAIGSAFFLAEIIPDVDFGDIFQFIWPTAFVLIGLLIIFRNPQRPVVGLIFIFLGLFFFSDVIFDWEFNIFQLWPLILIFIGLSVLFGSTNFNPTLTQVLRDEEKVNKTIIFWGNESIIKSENFKGGDYLIVFGGASLDLTQAKIANEGATLNLTAILGGIELKVSDKMAVNNKGVGVLGGFENKAALPDKPVGGTLEVTGTAILGGVEIRN